MVGTFIAAWSRELFRITTTMSSGALVAVDKHPVEGVAVVHAQVDAAGDEHDRVLGEGVDPVTFGRTSNRRSHSGGALAARQARSSHQHDRDGTGLAQAPAASMAVASSRSVETDLAHQPGNRLAAC